MNQWASQCPQRAGRNYTGSAALSAGLSLGFSAESAGRGSAVVMVCKKERAASPLFAGPDQGSSWWRARGGRSVAGIANSR